MIYNLGGKCLELEFCQVDGYISDEIFSFMNSSGGWLGGGKLNNLYSSSTGVIGEWLNLKMVFGADSVVISDVDDPTKSYTKTLSEDTTQLGITTSGNLRTMRFRNVRVYPVQ